MPRFFTSKENVTENRIHILGDDSFHIARSLRMAVGDRITVSDGAGTEYLCRLTSIRDEECICDIEQKSVSKTEAPLDMTLFMAYPKGDKLELVIQKAVELGVMRIIPFESERCIKRPKAEKIEKQTARLERIAQEAAKQCGRARVPRVSAPISFKEMLRLARESDLALFAYEDESEKTLKDILKKNSKITSLSIVVGSEGGFSGDEAISAKEEGLTSVSLGKRILRCETAPLYILSAVSYEFEL